MRAGVAGHAYGRWSFGVGVAALGVVALLIGDFLPGQPVPSTLTARHVLAEAAAVFMLAAAAGLLWRRAAPAAAAALTAYYVLGVGLAMNGPVVLRHATQFGAYSGVAEQLAIGAASLVVYAETAGIGAVSGDLARAGRVMFAVCVVLFGGAHFAYMNLTAPLVPRWLPPSQLFWGAFTGAAQIAAGAAILTGVSARLAAVLLTIMYAAFTPLVHLPMLLADPRSHMNWSENALNLALTGAAWVVADSLARRRRRGGRAKGA